MKSLLETIFLISLASAFVIQLFGKLGAIDRLASKSNAFFNRLLTCDFCLSFWTNFALFTICILMGSDADLIFVAALATPITRALL